MKLHLSTSDLIKFVETDRERFKQMLDTSELVAMEDHTEGIQFVFENGESFLLRGYKQLDIIKNKPKTENLN